MLYAYYTYLAQVTGNYEAFFIKAFKKTPLEMRGGRHKNNHENLYETDILNFQLDPIVECINDLQDLFN